MAFSKRASARERETVGCTTGGNGGVDRVPASVAKSSLLKPSLSGSQRAGDPLQEGRWGLHGRGGGTVVVLGG